MSVQRKIQGYWLAWAAVGFASAAAVGQPFMPLWFFITMIAVSQITTGIGILIVSRRAKRQELLWKMEKAFGPSTKPSENSSGRSGAT